MPDFLSLIFPFSYLAVLIGSLATFSHLYRKRQAIKSANLAPWFPEHIQRDVYISLFNQELPPGEKKRPAIPETVVKAALLRRATEDIRRIFEIRSRKQALTQLKERGSLGDDLWQRFLRAEKGIENEVREVVNEANILAPNWGQTIFQSANEMANNEMLRQRLDDIQSQVDYEKQWWENKRATIKADFMKELDEDASVTKKAEKGSTNPLSDDGEGSTVGGEEVIVTADTGSPSASSKGGKKKKAKK